MSSSRAVDYDALEATTAIEDITDDAENQEVLRLLRDDDGGLSGLYICEDAYGNNLGDYRPCKSEELGWLGHFAKKSTHLEEFALEGGDAFNNCSEQSIDQFFEDLGKCNQIRKLYLVWRNDLTEIMHKLDPAIKNNNITHWSSDGCYLGDTEANHIFNTFRDMKGLEELSIKCDDEDEHDLNDGVMAGCLPSLAACTGLRKLELITLDLSTSSCAALNAVFPRMAALRQLDLCGNSIDHNCVEVLVNGLVNCKHLHGLNLSRNLIGYRGLEMLVRGLPASVDTLDISFNEITLARQLPLLRFEKLNLGGNALSLGGNVLSLFGPRVIAASLANPECRLKELRLGINRGDEGAAILAESLRNNQRLTKLCLTGNITETGWNEFSSVLCNPASINATYGSNHKLQSLGGGIFEPCTSQNVLMMLQLNCCQDKSRIAATKILQTHRHLDMKPFFDRKLVLLPHVVAWLDRFAESRLDLKLSSIHEFVRAMPMEVVDGVTGKKKGKKRRRNRSSTPTTCTSYGSQLSRRGR